MEAHEIIAIALLSFAIGSVIGFCLTISTGFKQREESVSKCYRLYEEEFDRAEKLLEENKNLQISRDRWKITACHASGERNRLREEKQRLLDGIVNRELRIIDHEKEITDLRARLAKFDRTRGKDGRITGKQSTGL